MPNRRPPKRKPPRRPPNPRKMNEIIINHLKDWAAETAPIFYKDAVFIPNRSCILTDEDCAFFAAYIQNATPMEREALQATDLRTTLETWGFPDEISEGLVTVLKNAYKTALKESTPKKRKKRVY
ncbi:uncharacterized protein N7515_010202 [Penicillium bovifimosum]|uniref:Uncharacterized protein n=1 Tax=Penicillium bovifimosum TaxID=126998 RepID=A0A9W9GIC7_9EURO|nr:uncharacterized protein N7515_010202 [Penicillium bovifimosum]KAJ5120814.1 hypothetical protein N7515_010202 [Penicillium bovifimosum]